MSDIVCIAHRGASGNGHCPENTLAAFDKAIKIGADCVECDVHSTKDGRIVIMHDNTLNRTTDKKGAIIDMSLDEIKKADAGSWFAKEFANERVPTLREFLDLIKRKAIAVIEIKPDNITDKVIKDIEDADAAGDVLLQSFYPAAVKASLEISPRIPRALLIGGGIPVIRNSGILELLYKATEVGASTLNLSHNLITPALVKESHKRGVNVWAWTVDDETRMKELIEMNVDGITSNYPDKLLNVSSI